MSRKNEREVGAQKEQCAAEFLESRGYRILCRNYWCRRGEIDIIARDGAYLCFVEVKFRTSSQHGTACEAVDYRKQCRMRQAAQMYLLKNGYSEWTPCRFDVVAMDGEKIQLYQNAFEYA